ncbi:MAG TPA: hypothetical protein VHO70_05620 [Chitinispirillaceae bacterium]|nr:hypothetical protein [Chitinispirillaceae bacterium]
MTKLINAGIAVCFIIAMSVAQQCNDTNNRAGQDGMRLGGMMDSSAMCGMMMMHYMKPSAAFSTQDCGFVVIMGNKIMKFDKNADLKKEVEIKVDSTAMKKMMQQMQQCPMRKSGTSCDTAGKGAR